MKRSEVRCGSWDNKCIKIYKTKIFLDFFDRGLPGESCDCLYLDEIWLKTVAGNDAAEELDA